MEGLAVPRGATTFDWCHHGVNRRYVLNAELQMEELKLDDQFATKGLATCTRWRVLDMYTFDWTANARGHCRGDSLHFGRQLSTGRQVSMQDGDERWKFFALEANTVLCVHDIEHCVSSDPGSPGR